MPSSGQLSDQTNQLARKKSCYHPHPSLPFWYLILSVSPKVDVHFMQGGRVDLGTAVTVYSPMFQWLSW